MIVILILIVLAVMAILWFGFLSKDTATSKKASPMFSRQEIQIDFSGFDNPILDKLYFFEKIAAFEGEAGRENPFLPY